MRSWRGGGGLCKRRKTDLTDNQHIQHASYLSDDLESLQSLLWRWVEQYPVEQRLQHRTQRFDTAYEPHQLCRNAEMQATHVNNIQYCTQILIYII